MVLPVIKCLAALAVAANAAAVTSKNCVGLSIPVNVQAENTKFTVPRVDSNIDAVEFTIARELVAYLMNIKHRDLFSLTWVQPMGCSKPAAHFQWHRDGWGSLHYQRPAMRSAK